jgi:hypothetical protein
MNLSTNLPRSIKEYDSLPGQSQQKLRMNVNKEGDEVFMCELERTDPNRHSKLMRKMRLAERQARIRVLRAECKGGRPKKHVNNAAKQRAYRSRQRTGSTVTKPVCDLLILNNLQTQNQHSAISTAQDSSPFVTY